jgi:serine/threonine protein kinase
MERDRERFLREIRTTAQLEHPGIPAVYDTGVEGGGDGGTQLCLVMQSLRGSTLETLLDRTDHLSAPPTVAWAASIAAQVAGSGPVDCPGGAVVRRWGGHRHGVCRDLLDLYREVHDGAHTAPRPRGPTTRIRGHLHALSTCRIRSQGHTVRDTRPDDHNSVRDEMRRRRR